MHCLCVDPARVHLVWPLVKHLIRAAMQKGDISEFDDVERALHNGLHLLWLAADEHTIWAAAVTGLNTANGRKFCTIIACGGRERERWLPLKESIEQYARDESCNAMRLWGRKGWGREFPDYKLSKILLEKVL